MTILISIALFLIAIVSLLYIFVVAPITRMPGKSFKGKLPALRENERALADRLKAHVVKLAGEIGARSITSAPANLEAAATYLEDTWRASGLPVSCQQFVIEREHVEKHFAWYQKQGDLPEGCTIDSIAGKEVRNVIAEIPGDGSSDEIIVVGAHYDTPMDLPGANDNGTGVGAMLEIAEALKGKKLARTVRFVAYVNEEPPFFRTRAMGSAAHAKLCSERGEKIAAMMSLETIGCYSQEPGSQKYPKPFNLLYPSKGNFLCFIGNAASGKLVRQCVSLFRQNTSFPSEGSVVPGKVPGADFSDHLWYWHYGYPAIMVTDTAFCRYKHYHTHDDTPDKVDYESLARVVSGLTAMVESLAGGR